MARMPFTTSSQQKKAVLVLLQNSDKPLIAVDIADKVGIKGEHESKRRKVRALVKELRDEGIMIVANIDNGYWLTDEAAIWRDYNEGNKIDALKILTETNKRKKMLADKNGQGLLFANTAKMGIA